MQDPDYGTISDIDPDLSGDPPYTTLQGWFEDTYDDDGVQHARCHHGSATGLGALSTQTRAWTYAPTADEPVCIYAADGDEADGSRGDGNQGAAIQTGANAGIVTDWTAVRVAGLRFLVDGMLGAGIVAGSDFILIERCTIIIDGVAGVGVVVIQMQAGGVTVVTLRNNLILNTDSAIFVTGVEMTAVSGTSAINATCYNNSIINAVTNGAGIFAQAVLFGDVINMTTRNNVVTYDGLLGFVCFGPWGSGTVNWDGDYDVSTDATAVGADSKTDVDPADVWADITDPAAPFTPKADGELDPADGANLYPYGLETDAVGVERPTQGAHHRGGVEIFAGLYKAYGGPTGATVDYSAMLASVRAGTASMDIAPVRVAGGGTQWLGCRATSAAGVEETNTDRLARVVVDQFGQLQPLPLAAVRELTGERRADGAIIVGFSHITSPGWVAPTRFEVLSDNGTGELNLTTPVASIDMVDPAAIDYEVTVIPSVLPAMFSARACTQSASGPVAPAVTISPPSGPIAPQQV